MAKQYNKNRVEGRIDQSFMNLKLPDETMNEFVVRAFTCLRDSKRGISDGIEHAVFIKMCSVFIKKRIEMKFTKAEVEYLKSIIQKEVMP